MATDPTREELETSLAEWRKAETAAAAGLSYTVDGVTLTRHNGSQIKNAIAALRRQLIDLDQKEVNASARLGQRVPRWN